MESLSQVMLSLKLSVLHSSSDHIQRQLKDQHRSRKEVSEKVCSCSTGALTPASTRLVVRISILVSVK